MKKICCLIIALACLLAGCVKSAPRPASVVTKITVSTSLDRDTPIRVYSDSGKMKKLLDYLRLLDRRTVSEHDAQSVEGITWLITLHRSDGSITVYRHKAWRCLYSPRSGWQKIYPREAQRLALLLAAMPSDESSVTGS